MPKELQDKGKRKKIIPLVPKKYDCPECHIEIQWTPSNAPNIFLGVCPRCGMNFKYMNGMIIGGLKVPNQ